MKEQILEYLIGERDFDLGLILLNKYGNRKALSKLLDSCTSKGETPYNRNKLDIELIKLIGVSHKVVQEQKMRNYEVIIIEERVLRSATIDSVEEVDKEERLLAVPLGGATTHSVEDDLPKKK